MLVRKKPIPVEARQWFDNEDAPDAVVKIHKGRFVFSNGKPVVCNQCNLLMSSHGFIETLEGALNVCPGDWIMGPGFKGEFWAIKPDIFAGTYEEVK